MEESQSLSLRQVRQHCMECSGDSAPAVMWCTGDGHNSTLCRLWPYRFGRRPESFRRKYGPWLLMPQCMPGANVELETLPGKLADTIQWFQEHHPEVEWDGPEKPQHTPEELERLQQLAAQARRAQQRPGPKGRNVASDAAQLGRGPGFISTQPQHVPKPIPTPCRTQKLG